MAPTLKLAALLVSLIAVSAALTACNMDTTGGMQRSQITMSGDKIYEPD